MAVVINERPLHALPPGTSLNQLRLVRVLGQGGFGLIYEVEHEKLLTRYAVKEYFPLNVARREEGSSQVTVVEEEMQEAFSKGLQGFLREAQVLASLRHRHIVRILDYFEANGTGYLVMEFEEGNSLLKRVSRGGALAEKEVLGVIHPLLSALVEIHRSGLIHRDIKPDNIILRPNGEPVFIDFGSARYFGTAAASMTSLFSPGYSPFEQYGGESDQQGPWTDIYAMAAVACYLLSGQPPVDAQSRAACILSNQPDPFQIERVVGGRASSQLAWGIDLGMAFAASRRPRDVAGWLKFLPSLRG